MEKFEIRQIQFHFIDDCVFLIHGMIGEVIRHFDKSQVQTQGFEGLRIDGDNNDWSLDLHLQAQSRSFFICADYILFGGICRCSRCQGNCLLGSLEVIQEILKTKRIDENVSLTDVELLTKTD